jgi:branched-chain amino acid transport system ATP-binding protein
VTAALELVGASAGYGPVEVLHDVTVAFPAGSVVALIGRNGAGKSTVLRCLAGLVPLRTGVLRLDGHDITRTVAYERAAAGMTLIPDEHGTFADLTVAENLEVLGSGRPPAEALAVFPELGDRLAQRAGTLSGGEQQMLALSRLFMRPGRVVLVDELSRGLSPAVTARCYAALGGLVGPERIVVIVEQYLHEVMRLADIVYVMARGEVAFAGEPSELGSEYDPADHQPPHGL